MIFDLEKKHGVAIVDSDNNEIKYEDIVNFSNDIQNLRVKRSVVFILANNNVESLVGFIAFIENQLVPLLINENIDKELLEQYINIYEPKYIFTKNNIANLSYEEICIYRNYKLLETDKEIYPLFKDLSFLLSTSGTTGSPKLVRHSYINLKSSVKNVAKALNIDNTERALISLPIYFTQGLNVALSNLFVGATIFLSKFNLMQKEFFDFIKKQKVTSMTGVPYSYEILSRLGFFRMNLPDLKIINQGGGRLDDRLFKDIAEYARKYGKNFIPTYGSTETTSRMCFLNPDEAINKIGSIGKPIYPGKIKLVDIDNKEINEANVPGEIVYYGPNVTLGYAWNKNDLNLGDERCSKYETGDIAYFDESGNFFIIGRKGRFVKIFGYRIGLDEVEKSLKDKYKKSFACIGNDKKIKIFIEDHSLDVNEIKNFLSKKFNLLISIFEIIEIDKIPRNSYGKTMYKNLN